MSLRSLVSVSLLVLSSTAFADTVDINLRDSSVQMQYKSSFARDPLGKTEFHMGVLYAGKNNVMGDIGLLVKDELGNNAPGFSVGVGIKAVLARVKDKSPAASDASALALGAMLRYSPPTLRRMGLVGEIYASPNIVTFGDANRFIETNVRLEYEVIPSAVAYLGYRNVQFNLDNKPNATLDEGPFLGVRISF
jgi:hypothetical protein